MVEFTPEILAQVKAMGYTEEEAREKWSEIDEQYNQGGPAAVIQDMVELMTTTEGEVDHLAKDARTYFSSNRQLTEQAQNWIANTPGATDDARVLAWAQYLADALAHIGKALDEDRVDNDTLIHWLITATWMLAENQDQLAAAKDGNRRRGESG